MKGLLTVGLGLAVFSLARFFVSAIAEEHSRRDAMRHDKETMRWEGEGGNPVMPQSATSEM